MRMVKSQKTNGKISIDFVKIWIDFGKNFNIDMLKLHLPENGIKRYLQADIKI